MEIFNPDKLMRLGMPEDLTLGETRDFILSLPEFKNLADLSKRSNAKMRVRFMRRSDDTELPDTMHLTEFRALVSKDLAFISMDDEGGGTRTKALEPTY